MKSLKKQKDKITKICSNCFSPSHMLFNYSFISYGWEELNDTEKSQLFNRIYDLSSEEYLLISQRNKKIGIEFINENQIAKQIPNNFFNVNTHRNFSGKFCVFRLYPNNNPTAGRVIGVLINKIFYILFIDKKGKLYNH